MTRIDLLECLRVLTLEATGDLILPTSFQKGDEAPGCRAAEVHLMRLPDSLAAKKKAPYILHQLITGKDIQPAGARPSASAVVRSIFCVYSDNEEEGALMLLNLMERLRIRLLKQAVMDNRYQLDLAAGLEMLVYPDEIVSYCAGEMISTWKLPAVEREVML